MEVQSAARVDGQRKATEAAEAVQASEMDNMEVDEDEEGGDDHPEQEGEKGAKRRRRTIGVEMTVTTNAVNLAETKLTELRDWIDQEKAAVDAKLVECHGDADGNLAGGGLLQKQEIEIAVVNAKRTCGQLLTSFGPLKRDTAACTTHGGLKAISVQILELTGRVKSSQEIKVCKDLLSKSKRSCGVLMMAQKKAAAKTGVPVDKALEVPRNPLSAIIDAVIEKHPRGHNISSSVHEAKLGYKVAIVDGKVDAKGSAYVDQIRKNAYIKKLMKDTRAHAISTGRSVLGAQLFDMAKLKKVCALLKKAFDSNCLTKHVLPEGPAWANRIYTPEAVVEILGHAFTFPGSNGTIQARLQIEGSCNVIGLPLSAVPGESLIEQRNYLSQLTCDALSQMMLTKNGFCVTMTHEQDVCYLLPSGFMFLGSSQESKSLAWGVSGDDVDSSRVMNTLVSVLQSFPEFGNPGQASGAFLEWLRENVTG